MFAIICASGSQFKVKEGEKLVLNRLIGKEGEKVIFDQILLLSDDEGKEVTVGAPYTGGQVEAKILRHFKGDKIKIFKRKPKKRYTKWQGHRQYLTELEIVKISATGGAVKLSAPKVEARTELNLEMEVKKTAKKPVAKKESSSNKKTVKKVAKADQMNLL